jgi:hypothetical protein
MGGIGKTTIAQMAYNDSLVQERYAFMGWVHVSQTFDLFRLTIAITESLTRKSCNFNELSCVHDVLKKAVKGKTIFLVLDDLWDEWQDLLCSLKFAQSLTVLVTTRSKEVVRLVQTVEPFVLDSLPEDHCWSNLCNIRLKQLKHLKHILVTYVYSYCNICININ